MYLCNQVRDVLKERIANGQFPPGYKIPSERDLAINFNVSRPTVRQAIKELIAEGYLRQQPSKGTYTTKRQVFARKFVGLLVSPLLNNSFFSRLVAGIERAASSHGCNLVLRCANEDPAVEKQCLQELLESGILGLIVSPGVSSLANLARYAEASRRLPLVMADISLRQAVADYVASDDEAGAYAATLHLIELGHQSILHLAGHQQHSTALLRRQGYQKALRAKNIPLHEDLVRITDWSIETGYYETKKFLLNNRRRISAIFACTDEVAAGACRAIRELALRVPQDISLVGYGNLDIANFLDVPLTTVEQHPEKMGAEAFTLIQDPVAGKLPAREPRQVVVPTRLVIRESCGVKMPPRIKPLAPA